jgi:hypothetical protein
MNGVIQPLNKQTDKRYLVKWSVHIFRVPWLKRSLDFVSRDWWDDIFLAAYCISWFALLTNEYFFFNHWRQTTCVGRCAKTASILYTTNMEHEPQCGEIIFEVATKVIYTKYSNIKFHLNCLEHSISETWPVYLSSISILTKYQYTDNYT